MPGRFWSQADEDLLAELAGDHPWRNVPALFNQRAQVKRTECALRRHCAKLGIPRDCVGQYVSPWLIANSIGCSHARILRWIKRGWLPVIRFGNTGGYGRWVKRSDLRKLARARPELFGGMTEGDLVMLLSSETLAEEIAAMQLPRLRQAQPVICIETGWRYSSIDRAAKAAFCSPQRMQQVVRGGGTINGRRYRAA